MRFIAILTILALSGFSMAKQPITWLAYNQPPAYIFQGEYSGKGFINLAQNELINVLPQYNHLDQQVTVGRFLHNLKLKKDACVFGLHKTVEREQYILFSEPALYHPNVRVLISKEKANELQLNGLLDLTDLLNKHNLTTHLIESRSYGKIIDNIVKDYPNKVFYRASHSNSALFKMLDRGRFDFMITYPSAASFALKNLQLKNEYVLLPIKGIPLYISSAIGCSKTAWGKQTIKDINVGLKQVVKTQQYFDALSFWIEESMEYDKFHNYYKNEFLAPYKN